MIQYMGTTRFIRPMHSHASDAMKGEHGKQSMGALMLQSGQKAAGDFFGEKHSPDHKIPHQSNAKMQHVLSVKPDAFQKGSPKLNESRQGQNSENGYRPLEKRYQSINPCSHVVQMGR